MSNNRNELIDSVREWRETYASDETAEVGSLCESGYDQAGGVQAYASDETAEVTTKCDDNFAMDGAMQVHCRCGGSRGELTDICNKCDSDMSGAGGAEPPQVCMPKCVPGPDETGDSNLTDICNKCGSDVRRQDWSDEDSARVLAHDIPPYILERTVSDGDFETIEEAEEAGAEFLKFLVLSMSTSERIGMVSERVDAIWHAYILFTNEYHQLSRNVIGVNYFHHAPTRTDGDSSPSPPGSSATNFLQAYAARFGALPSVWLRATPDAHPLETKCSKDDGFPCGPGSDCN